MDKIFCYDDFTLRTLLNDNVSFKKVLALFYECIYNNPCKLLP